MKSSRLPKVQSKRDDLLAWVVTPHTASDTLYCKFVFWNWKGGASAQSDFCKTIRCVPAET